MKGFLGKLERLDRRVIYVVLATVIVVPVVFPLGLPLKPGPVVEDFYQAVDSIPDDATVLVAMDYDPAGKPELHPMNLAVLRHLFSPRPGGGERGIKVVALTLWPAGPPLARQALDTVAKGEFGKTYGVDYVNLGYKEGREIVMSSMGTDIHQTFPKDIDGTPVGDLPLMRDVRNYDDVSFLVMISAGYPGLKEWVQQVQAIYGVEMAGGTTGVSAPEYYPYYQSRQIKGLLEGLKGAAEYEKLIGIPGTATSGMDAQSTGHWTIGLFIILGNVLYFLGRRRP